MHPEIYKKMTKAETMAILKKYCYNIRNLKNIYDEIVNDPSHSFCDKFDWFYGEHDIHVDNSLIIQHTVSEVIEYLKTVRQDAIVDAT